jgi:hypothetical protein
MKHYIKNILLLFFTALLAYLFRGELSMAWNQLRLKYFPCKEPIYYSLGVFDDRFGISEEEFLLSLSSAEVIWEKEAGRDLFAYKEGGKLKINLIYDTRQEVTEKLKKLDSALDNRRGSYNEVKVEYEALKKEYERDKKSFSARLALYEERKAKYEEEVQYWNSKGGANKTEYERLQSEQEYLKGEGVELANLEDTLNFKIDELNTLAATLNKIASSLNINVAEFNEVTKEHGGEFEEGTYESGPDGERINIYQFDDEGKLRRVLSHEFGHALGLEHVEDEKAIMYRLNNGINHELTKSDIDALKMRCSLN